MLGDVAAELMASPGAATFLIQQPKKSHSTPQQQETQHKEAAIIPTISIYALCSYPHTCETSFSLPLPEALITEPLFFFFSGFLYEVLRRASAKLISSCSMVQ